ncbi:hypothetical protein [Streptomyces sp. NPDC046631]|uniref:hypothetical protein n=1 Tax=unclassified Streptomyces TaxID=2593676 RepID=UPI0033D3F7FE
MGRLEYPFGDDHLRLGVTVAVVGAGLFHLGALLLRVDAVADPAQGVLEEGVELPGGPVHGRAVGAPLLELPPPARQSGLLGALTRGQPLREHRGEERAEHTDHCDDHGGDGGGHGGESSAGRGRRVFGYRAHGDASSAMMPS